MELITITIFTVFSALLIVLGYAYKREALLAIGGLSFILFGLILINAGYETITGYTSVENKTIDLNDTEIVAGTIISTGTETIITTTSNVYTAERNILTRYFGILYMLIGLYFIYDAYILFKEYRS